MKEDNIPLDLKRKLKMASEDFSPLVFFFSRLMRPAFFILLAVGAISLLLHRVN